MSSNPVGVAIVTGGSSGIGLAVANHLMAKKWHVFILDVQPPRLPLLPESGTFLRTDVGNWEQLASAFQTAYSRFSRLDFCALNAGIESRDDILYAISEDPAKPPRKPNMQTFEVNLFSPYYGLKLAAHYMSHNPEPATHGGRVVITASKAAFMEGDSPTAQYTASKYGALGLTRAIARSAEAVGIRVNCVCPGMVATGMATPAMLRVLPASAMTPMAVVLRAFDELAEFDRLAAGGRAAWVGRGPVGAAIVADRHNLIPRPVVMEDIQDFLGNMEDGMVWTRAFQEKIKQSFEADDRSNL